MSKTTITEEPLPGLKTPPPMYCYEMNIRTHEGQALTRLFAAAGLAQVYEDTSNDITIKEITSWNRLGPIKVLEL